jgi:hypothetical protein
LPIVLLCMLLEVQLLSTDTALSGKCSHSARNAAAATVVAVVCISSDSHTHCTHCIHCLHADHCALHQQDMSYNTLHAHPPVALAPINEIRRISQELRRGGGVKTNRNYMTNYSSRGSTKNGGLTGENATTGSYPSVHYTL